MLPTALFLLCPLVLAVCRKRYILTPPTGSVLARFWKLWMYVSKGCWSINPITTYKRLSAPGFWDRVKPSHIPLPSDQNG